MTDETLRQAITAYLTRLPASELGNCGPIADVLLPEVPRGWRRVLDELHRMEADGLVTYLSHQGWRLKS